MKPESLKHLQNLYERTDDKYFRETIEAIIRLELETKSNIKRGRFSMWDYVIKDNDLRPSMCCILHDSGFKVASDAHIMVVLKEDYPEDMEGKMMRKDGTIYEDGKFPNRRMVIPDPKKNEYFSVRLDFAEIREFEKDFKAKKKLNKKLEGYVKVGFSYFKVDLLMKAVRFMECVGTDELMLSPDGKRAALAVAGDSKMILMPVIGHWDTWDDDHICYGIYKKSLEFTK